MKKYYLFLIASFSCGAFFVHAQTPDINGIVYVKVGGTGNGSSWANATGSLQGAINAVGTQQVWVAKGIYDVPSPSSFVMKNGVAIYGGFDPEQGIDDLTDARILPGTGLQGTILNGKNERPVIFNADNGLTVTAILDGFTITGGAGNAGGGIYGVSGSPTFRNLLLKGNSATIGGAMYIGSSSPVITNVAMVNNTANDGGGIYHVFGSPVLTNVTIANNTANRGSALYLMDGPMQLRNTIVFGVVSLEFGMLSSQYSLIEGRISTANNNLNATGILASHVFVNPANGNYALVTGSPAIDKGSNSLFAGLAANSKDLAGQDRAVGNVIDLGAYEYHTATPSAGGIVHVTTTGMGKGTSWTDATGDLHAAINANGAQQVWVAKGTYEVSASSFVMKNGLAMYGGFDPDQGIDGLTDQRILASRGIAATGSILSGRNERPVIWNYATAGNPINTTAILDGFTLTAGAGGGSNGSGAGMYNSYASPKLSNLVFKNNNASLGAGMYNENNSAPLLTHCVFFDNQTSNLGSGGAMYNSYSNPKLVNCLMYNNKARLGGAIFNAINAFPSLINCTLVANHADAYGGAMNSMAYSNPSFANSIVYGNTANLGDNGIVKDVSVANPLDYFNASLIQGATSFDGNDNISFGGALTDIFNDPANHDYTLKIGGPAINMGRNNYLNEAGLTTDLAGNPRLRGSSVDLGVYEAEACATTSVIYVDATVNNNGSGPVWVTPTTGNGASWATAYKTLKDALALANQCANITEIRVAKGTYYPTGTNGVLGQSDVSFTLTRSNLKILGGYNAGTGLRDIAANPTILSGNVGADPTYHVMLVVGVPTTDSLVVDGFTIANGLANNPDDYKVIDNSYYIFHDSGAGMFISNVGNNVVVRNCTFQNNKATLGGGLFSEIANAVIENCIFKQNSVSNNAYFSGSGAGMYSTASEHRMANCTFESNTNLGNDGGGLFGDNATFLMSNSKFINNTAAGNGGALRMTSSQSILNNCVFNGNTASKDGGAIYSSNAHPILTNVSITNNSATVNGGGMYSANGNPVFTNVTIADNTAAGAKALYLNGSGTPILNNAIVYGGVTGTYTAKYSLIEGNAGGTNGNLSGTLITSTQLFVNPLAKDYTLLRTSPVLNAGSNVLFTGLDMNTKDLAGNPRLVGTNIDLGAYEYPYTIMPDANGIVYVRTTALGKQDGSSWNDATADLHNAIHAGSVVKVFVATGNYNVGAQSFVMKNNVAIYGGFDPQNAITDLTHHRVMPNAANIQGTVLNGQNARPVIWNVFDAATAMNNTAVLDGFTITNGAYSNGAGIRNVYASPILRNLVIMGNNGTSTGAGIHNDHASPLIINSLISNNYLTSSSSVYGAGIYNTNVSAPIIINATIADNRLGSPAISIGGAGIYSNNASAPEIYNSIIWNNKKNSIPTWSGADIESQSATTIIKHSITQSFTTGNTADQNKVGEDPLFLGADFKLQTSSPAINTGNNSFFVGLNTNTKDLAGNERLNGANIDMGVYEYQAVLPVTLISFTAKKEGNNAKLLWETAAEQNNQKFEIYRSGEDKLFTKLGEVGGKQMASAYIFTDKQPLKGNNYYKLVQVDADGKPTDLGERVLNFDFSAANVTVYPNPTASSATIVFGAGKYSQLMMSNVEGKVLQQQAISIMQTEAVFDLSAYPKGVYFIRLKGLGEDTVQKVMKL